MTLTQLFHDCYQSGRHIEFPHRSVSGDDPWERRTDAVHQKGPRGRPTEIPNHMRPVLPCDAMAYHSTAQHSTAQHSTAQHSTAPNRSTASHAIRYRAVQHCTIPCHPMPSHAIPCPAILCCPITPHPIPSYCAMPCRDIACATVPHRTTPGASASHGSNSHPECRIAACPRGPHPQKTTPL